LDPCLLALCLLIVTLAISIEVQAQAGDWMRLGDALVEGGAPDGLERALDAYGLVDPSGPDALRVLERRAFVNFLLGRMTASIACYVPLLDQLERDRSSVGRVARRAMREEALVVLASVVADPDWDRDGVPEATAMTRLADPALIPQDRAWLAPLYFATGRSLYFTSRDPAAIAVFDHALGHWPAPEHGTLLEAACRRHHARPTTLPDEDPGDRSTANETCARHAF